MNRSLKILAVLILMSVSLLAGAWISYHAAVRAPAPAGRTILHYVDPMHPSYTSDKPGIAPDCGMPLEPVYADGGPGAGAGGAAQPAPGTVQVAPDRLQLIGVQVAPAEVSPAHKTLRFSGRVVPDETRTFIINATIDGWITRVTQVTTGSIVREDQVLASFYSPDFLSASSALIFALGSMDRVQAMGQGAPQGQVQKDQMAQFNVSLQQYKDALRNLGMGKRQIEEMMVSRKYAENIDITAPGYGVVLARNLSDGQRFVKGEQFFKIGDLRKIWVLIDVYQNEVDLLKPGMPLTVTQPQRGRSYHATVSPVPPIFDPLTRTLKVRLNVDNPGMLLRPDMFVDVELPVNLPEMLAVPAEAVLDSGLKKTVFVEKGPGTFEPREVETGRSAGNRVEIVSGIKPGERIAVSGTFLLDSESRMKRAAAGISGVARQDPVCGMYVDEAKARAAGNFVEGGGSASYFCSNDCKQKFLKNPAAKQAHAALPSPAPVPAPPAPLKRPAPGGQKRAPATAAPAGSVPDHADHAEHAKGAGHTSSGTGPAGSHEGHAMQPGMSMTQDTGKRHD